MGTCRGEHIQVLVGRPLEVVAQVVAIGLERSAVVASQECGNGKLRVIGRLGRLLPADRRYDVIGAAVCLVGVGVMMFAPR